MKKIINTIVTMVVIVVMLSVCSYVESHYTRTDCTVVETEGQLVTVEDSVGYLWSYEVEGTAPSIGTEVNLHMHTNYTDSTIYDDIVLEVEVQD